MSRATQLLLSLAALMVLLVGALLLVSLFGNPFHRVTDRAVPLTAGTDVPRTAPRLHLGRFADMGAGLMRAPLLADWGGVESYYSKDVSNAAVNLLYATPQGDRWLYPPGDRVLTQIEDIGPGEADAPTATLITVVEADTNVNGTLSLADGARLILMRPDGTAPQTLAEGLTEPASLSPGQARWLLSWTDREGATMLSDINPRTGGASAPRRLDLPDAPPIQKAP